MATDSDEAPDVIENVEEVLNKFKKELDNLYMFRDLFFENHPIEMAANKSKLIEDEKEKLIKDLESIDPDTQIPKAYRAQFLYMKGRCYNVNTTYDPRASQCLSKAVKLNPHMIDAWNELGECYWKNKNVQEAKASFEGALKHERNKVTLRCLSIILRQESNLKTHSEVSAAHLKSVQYAKEAVTKDLKDGVSWTVLGNAYLCQYFSVFQDPLTLKSCMSAYKQAYLDPVARGQSDFYYNKAVALRYGEIYDDALDSFEYACRLDPLWDTPKQELNLLIQYLSSCCELIKTKGKIKAKKIKQIVQSTNNKMLGEYSPGSSHKFGSREVTFDLTTIDKLNEGRNEGKVILGQVVGSVYNSDKVPFTFAIVDRSMVCIAVNVYNWGNGLGAIIGANVAIPEPTLTAHSRVDPPAYNFKSIRVNNPTRLLINGKRVAPNQLAAVKVTSTYEIH